MRKFFKIALKSKFLKFALLGIWHSSIIIHKLITIPPNYLIPRRNKATQISLKSYRPPPHRPQTAQFAVPDWDLYASWSASHKSRFQAQHTYMLVWCQPQNLRGGGERWPSHRTPQCIHDEPAAHHSFTCRQSVAHLGRHNELAFARALRNQQKCITHTIQTHGDFI